MSEKVHSRHLNGISNTIYLKSLDFGWNGFYAVAFGNLINIYSSSTGESIIILSGIHQVTITHVKFEPSKIFDSEKQEKD